MAINRRTFLKRSAASGLALAVPSILMADRAGKYRTALISSGWWGMNIARVALQSGECKLVAMCDVDQNQLDPAASEVEQLSGDEPSYPFVRASGGAISTAWDFAIFCQMFLNGGIYNGKQMLKPQTVKKMVSKQSVTIYPPEKRRDFKKYYGFGWFVGEDGVFSHSGSDGTFAWIDPNNQIIGLVFTQSPGGKLANLREQFMKVVDASICKR